MSIVIIINIRVGDPLVSSFVLTSGSNFNIHIYIYSLVRLANNPEISLIKDELSIKILF
ncbi:hypothetical protein [Borreliella garinii]|uniref:hypothetical protein n=1 Tax=Borreliella garinii TaxID=29519 RepID=UPI001AED48C9|nr:hypothetical protein [Borreliella garinii]